MHEIFAHFLPSIGHIALSLKMSGNLRESLSFYPPWSGSTHLQVQHLKHLEMNQQLPALSEVQAQAGRLAWQGGGGLLQLLARRSLVGPTGCLDGCHQCTGRKAGMGAHTHSPCDTGQSELNGAESNVVLMPPTQVSGCHKTTCFQTRCTP